MHIIVTWDFPSVRSRINKVSAVCELKANLPLEVGFLCLVCSNKSLFFGSRVKSGINATFRVFIRIFAKKVLL